MTVGGRTALAVVVLGLSVTGASAQSVTGPEKAVKPSALSAERVLTSGDLRWTRWSDAELVALWVHEPIKAMGMRSFAEDERVALRIVVDDAEADVRSVLEGMRGGAIDPATASEALWGRLQQLSASLAELASTR